MGGGNILHFRSVCSLFSFTLQPLISFAHIDLHSGWEGKYFMITICAHKLGKNKLSNL